MNVETIIQKLEHQKTAIANALLALRGIDNSGSKTTTLSTGNGTAKRKFSSATRRKMAEAQQKRWASKRVENPVTEVTTEAPPQEAPQAINRRSRKTQSRSAA